ncbi:leucyl/phenylalanyl-tRNA--protein transferase [Marinimicrobium koreense]|uniref:Leucyl/phenylalanyl-tRNA--protein transferase n=1 Tax=Marinimicrobium koreense TaxID=306545 RepID=A0A3N1NKZ4_9GAMM|nr:leucyl/phenylalanyl-tRNA--protein transferase [Marinimicrobium koreense]ROQ20454.1 leucyl/phenylalanyl-tRNA--protein transferase [Marinimicrobium koreense]
MITLPWLEPNTLDFPPTTEALDEPNGLLAGGGDLSPERLMRAYRLGIFPWYEEGQPILWWTPDPRAVLFPDHLHVSRSLRKTLKRGEYRVTCDQAFEAVMRACAAPRDGASGTWITDDMLAAYTRLHRQGVAHSIEVWQEERLVGGLYGLALGRVFFGESMFTRADNASKVGFVHLVAQLKAWHFELIDCQVGSAHLFSLGAEEISREAFEKILLDYAYLPSISGPWHLNQPVL